MIAESIENGAEPKLCATRRDNCSASATAVVSRKTHLSYADGLQLNCNAGIAKIDLTIHDIPNDILTSKSN